MILPTKHIHPSRCLMGIGAELLPYLRSPKTVSALWDIFRKKRSSSRGLAPVDYDWFVLAIDLLFTLGAIELKKGVLKRSAS